MANTLTAAIIRMVRMIKMIIRTWFEVQFPRARAIHDCGYLGEIIDLGGNASCVFQYIMISTRVGDFVLSCEYYDGET